MGEIISSRQEIAAYVARAARYIHAEGFVIDNWLPLIDRRVKEGYSIVFSKAPFPYAKYEMRHFRKMITRQSRKLGRSNIYHDIGLFFIGATSSLEERIQADSKEERKLQRLLTIREIVEEIDGRREGMLYDHDIIKAAIHATIPAKEDFSALFGYSFDRQKSTYANTFFNHHEKMRVSAHQPFLKGALRQLTSWVIRDTFMEYFFQVMQDHMYAPPRIPQQPSRLSKYSDLFGNDEQGFQQSS